MELYIIINQITCKHRVLGEIVQETVECYNNKFYTSAFFNLFIIIEHFCKFCVDFNSGYFYQTINKLHEEKKITLDEKNLLDNFKRIRNKMFHENLAMWVLEIDGIAYSFSENETRKFLYEKYAKKIFEVILKLLEQNEIIE